MRIVDVTMRVRVHTLKRRMKRSRKRGDGRMKKERDGASTRMQGTCGGRGGGGDEF
jgi:hypothetical protein